MLWEQSFCNTRVLIFVELLRCKLRHSPWMISRGSTQKVLNSANLELRPCFLLLHSSWPCCLCHLDHHRSSGSSFPSSSSSSSLSSSSSHNYHERHYSHSVPPLLLCSAHVYSLFLLMFSHCQFSRAVLTVLPSTRSTLGPSGRAHCRPSHALNNVFKSLHQIWCFQRHFFVPTWSCRRDGSFLLALSWWHGCRGLHQVWHPTAFVHRLKFQA